MDAANDAPKPLPPKSFDKTVEEIHNNMAAYKKAVDGLGGSNKELYASDRKKLLSLPFMLNKRQEAPIPKEGQKEYTLFKTIFGKSWNFYENLEFDTEEKITEFNYEKFIPSELLKDMDTKSADFKTMIKKMNLNMKTSYEKHCEAQESFKKLMPILRTLDEEETEIFLHMMRNNNRSTSNTATRTNDLIDKACSDEEKERLAKLSEDANFALKNTYVHQNQTMQYADKKRMPIDSDKVRDILRN